MAEIIEDKLGLYAARWLILLRRAGLPDNAKVSDVLALLGQPAATHISAGGRLLSETERTYNAMTLSQEYIISPIPDRAGRRWRALIRTNGSICLFYTAEGRPGQFVVYDTLDDQLAAAPSTEAEPAPDVCPHCRGDKFVANSDDQEPWSLWLDLPLRSANAVLLGIVRPVTCPTCHGTGRAPGGQP